MSGQAFHSVPFIYLIIHIYRWSITVTIRFRQGLKSPRPDHRMPQRIEASFWGFDFYLARMLMECLICFIKANVVECIKRKDGEGWRGGGYTLNKILKINPLNLQELFGVV